MICSSNHDNEHIHAKKDNFSVQITVYWYTLLLLMSQKALIKCCLQLQLRSLEYSDNEIPHASGYNHLVDV